MNYVSLRPPFPLDFEEMSEARLGHFREWFLKVIPERLEQLTAVVHQLPSHAAWAADESPDSLDMLGDWFAAHIEMRARTKAEIDKLTNNGRLTIEGVEADLSNVTFSLATDVGMYLGRAILNNVPGTAWDQETRKNVNYGQMIIRGLGPTAYNPVRAAITSAYTIAAGQPSTLRGLYERRLKAQG